MPPPTTTTSASRTTPPIGLVRRGATPNGAAPRLRPRILFATDRSPDPLETPAAHASRSDRGRRRDGEREAPYAVVASPSRPTITSDTNAGGNSPWATTPATPSSSAAS